MLIIRRWAAGYYQAMKQNGLFTSDGGMMKFQLGVDKDGKWLNPASQLEAGATYAVPAIYGLQILTGSQTFTYSTTDAATIVKIADMAGKAGVHVVVQTSKGLATNSNGFKGDLSEGPHEYALLGLKPDGG